jgi:hypothetical protein
MLSATRKRFAHRLAEAGANERATNVQNEAAESVQNDGARREGSNLRMAESKSAAFGSFQYVPAPNFVIVEGGAASNAARRLGESARTSRVIEPSLGHGVRTKPGAIASTLIPKAP